MDVFKCWYHGIKRKVFCNVIRSNRHPSGSQEPLPISWIRHSRCLRVQIHRLTRIGITIIKITRSHDHLIFIRWEFHKCRNDGLYIETGPPWWRHQMETFSALLALSAGNSPVTGEFPAQRPVTRGFDVFFDLRLNERLSKQSWSWWFETPLRPVWCCMML